MSVTFCGAVPTVDPTYGPMMVHDETDGPSVNLSNSNAKPLLLALTLVDPDEEGEPEWIGSLPLDDFRGRLLVALALAPSDPGKTATIEQRPGGPVIIDGGRPVGYLQARLRQLLELTDAAEAIGHTHIGWH